MSTLPRDPLYRLFEARLHSGDYDDQPTEVLLRDVVDAYWTEVGADANVPVRLRDNVKADLTEDVRDMLRIKIYGNNGVGEYNRRRTARG